jgi:hypothetical protein
MKEMPEPWFRVEHGKQWPLWVGAPCSSMHA